jgi:hypothetical protein
MQSQDQPEVTKLEVIKARWARIAGLDQESVSQALVDVTWLVSYVERLREDGAGLHRRNLALQADNERLRDLLGRED